MAPMAPALILGIVSASLAAVGTGVAVVGALSQGKAASEASKAQAKLSGLQAEAEIRRGDQEEAALRRRTRLLIGQQRAGYSAAGVRLEGTPLLVTAQTLTDSEKDILNLNKETDAKALAYRFGAATYETAASAARTASYWSAGASLLTGGSQIAGTVSNMKFPVKTVQSGVAV